MDFLAVPDNLGCNGQVCPVESAIAGTKPPANWKIGCASRKCGCQRKLGFVPCRTGWTSCWLIICMAPGMHIRIHIQMPRKHSWRCANRQRASTVRARARKCTIKTFEDLWFQSAVAYWDSERPGENGAFIGIEALLFWGMPISFIAIRRLVAIKHGHMTNNIQMAG